MKNGPQKSRLSPVSSAIRSLLEGHPVKGYAAQGSMNRKEIWIRFYFIFVCGLLASLSIQSDIGIEQFLGGLFICSLLMLILYRDIMRYKPSFFKRHTMLLLLGTLLVGTMLTGRLFAYLLTNLSKGLEYQALESAFYGIPIPAGAMLVSLLFDFHAAIMFSFAVSLLTGIWLHDASFTLYAFVGSITAAFSVMRCKKRSEILRGGGFVIVANVVTILCILLFQGALFTAKGPQSILFGALCGISVAAIVSLTLPLIEYFFKVTTDISLLELLDLNQPLMKTLMVSAPGTYHHSVIVGTLAESAAEIVGANPLLARVSAYYHDIGKIKMPDYFVENQSGTVSKHDKLTPHMSSMIITNHVKEGIELAKEYKLPAPIIDIIAQHHGTMLISYFYQKAREREGNGSQPSEEDYRYPGPKPQSRVAALVMMADGVEAASRVLADPTPARIASLVDRIINHIFLEGQLDECELTLKDIHEIKKRFTYILTGIFHKRVDYPGFDFNGERHDQEPAKTRKGKHSESGTTTPEDAPSAAASQS